MGSDVSAIRARAVRDGSDYVINGQKMWLTNDLEADMANTSRPSAARRVVEDSFRIHGGYGFSTEYEIERLYREAPMPLIGEGTAEIQKMIIGRRLLEEYRITG